MVAGSVLLGAGMDEYALPRVGQGELDEGELGMMGGCRGGEG